MSQYPGYNSGRFGGPPQPQYHQQPQGNYYPPQPSYGGGYPQGQPSPQPPYGYQQHAPPQQQQFYQGQPPQQPQYGQYQQGPPQPNFNSRPGGGGPPPPPLLQPLNSSVMALPIATTSDTQTAPAGEKPS
ncbi:hypothetical protein NXS19_010248 [Fusarium pseudograminearum]|nr:hypothetical protein NXS19_010248 [Fusarium pseudograminearum]